MVWLKPLALCYYDPVQFFWFLSEVPKTLSTFLRWQPEAVTYHAASKETLMCVLYRHLAYTLVQKNLSLTSGRVVNLSFRKPSKPDCVVFSTVMSFMPLWITGVSGEQKSHNYFNKKHFRVLQLSIRETSSPPTIKPTSVNQSVN